MLLDELFPDFDFHEFHAARVQGSPDQVLAAARTVTPQEIRLMRPLMALRAVPSHLTGKPLTISADVPFFEQALGLGFLTLGERQDELVIGAIGKFWSPSGNRPISLQGPEDFLSFEQPGFAKVAMNIAVSAQGVGTRLTTETRIAATDTGSRRRFRLYWLLIGPWSALIRRGLLQAVRRRVDSEGGRRARPA